MSDLILALLTSYLLGSIPAGYLLGRLKGVDLRRAGSGNVGATNAGRVLGRRFGLLAFAFDFLKGVTPATVVAGFLLDRGRVDLNADALRILLGGAAIFGHVFPVWLGFKGGKGVATSAGVCAAIHPTALLVALLVWAVVLRLTRFMSAASITGAFAFPVAFVALVGPHVAFGERLLVTALATVLAIAITYLHRSNIGRLMRGEELRIGTPRTGDGER